MKHRLDGTTRRSGQVALVVAMVVVVGLTLAVAVASRSVTTVSISGQEEDRARAFSAAEAGVEDALRQDLSVISGGSFSLNDASSVSYSVEQVTEFITEVEPGEVLTIDWSQGTGTDATVSWDACATLYAKQISTSGTVVTVAVESGSPATYSKGSNKLLRLRFIGCRSAVTISSSTGTLSFYQVDSVGTSGESQSRVEVYRSLPAPISLMDFAVFSGTIIE